MTSTRSRLGDRDKTVSHHHIEWRFPEPLVPPVTAGMTWSHAMGDGVGPGSGMSSRNGHRSIAGTIDVNVDRCWHATC